MNEDWTVRAGGLEQCAMCDTWWRFLKAEYERKSVIPVSLQGSADLHGRKIKPSNIWSSDWALDPLSFMSPWLEGNWWFM